MNCSSIPGSNGGVTVTSDNCFASARDQAARHEGDEIGAGGDVQRLDIAGHDQRDPPLDALGAQPAVDQVLALAADHDGDMARGSGRPRASSASQPAGWPRRTASASLSV